MYVELTDNNGTKYLRLVKSLRVTDSKGVKTAKKVVVRCIGPLSRFDDGKPDYVVRLKESFRKGEPIIPVLQEYCSKEKPKESVTLTFSEGDDICFGQPKNFSQVIMERIFEELGLIKFLTECKCKTGCSFDLLGFFRSLAYGRILQPASKFSTMRQNKDYYIPPLSSDSYAYNVYDTLDIIHSYSKSIIRTVHKSMTEKFHRTTGLTFYDVTNFFFEIDEPDEDCEAEGNIYKGLRKLGVSKEQRHQPIVQVGLFMDEQGVPISLEMFPGNTLDHQTMIAACRNTVDTLGLSRFVFVGDRGMCYGPNIVHLLDCGNGYVMSRSINGRKCTQEDKRWVLEQEGYTEVNDGFKYKSRIVTRTVTEPSNSAEGTGKTGRSGKTTKRVITEKQVVYWSKKFHDRSFAEKRNFFEFLEKLRTAPGNFRITALQAKSIRKYMKREMINSQTGEIVDSFKIKAMLDEDMIKEELELMGYYMLVTSETEKEDTEIIDIYHRLSRIEDEFRVMKGTLETRPVYVRTKEHIHAHLLICMLALVVIRIIQQRILDCQKADTVLKAQNREKCGNKKQTKRGGTNLWEMGLSAERIQNALNKLTVDLLPNDYYRFNNVTDPDVALILKAFGIEIQKKLYRRAELKQIKTGITFTK